MKIIYFVLILSVLFISYPAKGDLNNCEQLADEYQDTHYGSLIYLNPINDNGSYDLCRYCGHWINKAYSKDRGIYYYDSQSNQYFKTEQEVKEWYSWIKNKNVEMWDISISHPPFALIRN